LIACPAGIWNSTESGILGGPYEPAIGMFADALSGFAAFSEPVVAWHILIASI
jgi:hypothetical protein